MLTFKLIRSVQSSLFCLIDYIAICVHVLIYCCSHFPSKLLKEQSGGLILLHITICH